MIPSEILSLSTLIFCFLTILLMLRCFAKSGLIVYSAIATITANIQVVKLTQYTLVNDPVALGTVVFATTFAVDNILTEYYGKNVAQKNIWISFTGYLFFVICMKIAVMHGPIQESECMNLSNELERLFSPSAILFVSSLISYMIGQFSDVTIFSFLKKFFKNKFITLRSFLSMSVSTFIDNFVFSICAWYIFAQNPISFSTLWKTYVCVTYIIRLVIAILCVPLVKLAGKVIRKENV